MLFVCYYFINKKHLKSPRPPTDKHAGVEYSVLETKGTGQLSVIQVCTGKWVLQTKMNGEIAEFAASV